MRNSIFTIYRKELKDVLRDRKTLFLIVVIPIIAVPLLFNALISFTIKTQIKASTEPLQYTIFGEEHMPDLSIAFEGSSSFEKVSMQSPEEINQAIQESTIQFALVIPENAETDLEQHSQTDIEFHYNNASLTSRVKERASRVINTYNEKLTAIRLLELGLSESDEQEALLQPIILEEKGTADMREIMGNRFGGMLPYLFIAFCYLGVVYPAVHLGAGEKERGTLETLLLAPVPRYQITLGKFLVVFTGGIMAVLLNLTSLGIWLSIKAASLRGVLGQVISAIEWFDLVLIALMLVPIAAMFAALLLSVSIFARNASEASTYMSPISILMIVPAVLALLPGVELNWKWAMVPLTNIALAIKELVKGTMDYSMLVAIFGSSFVIALVFLLFCAKWFERESVIFRE